MESRRNGPQLSSRHDDDDDDTNDIPIYNLNGSYLRIALLPVTVNK